MSNLMRALSALALLAFTSVTACVADDTIDGDSDVGEQLGASGPGATETLRHCAIEAIATPIGETPDANARSDIKCFATFSEAVFTATHGSVRLAPEVTPASVPLLPATTRAAMDEYLLGIEYVHSRWNGRSYVVKGTSSCATSDHHIRDLRDVNMNDTISSVYTASTCAHAYHYEHADFGGARIDCPPAHATGGHDTCYYGLGAMDDRASSVLWTNH